jgi:hypothetical protein
MQALTTALSYISQQRVVLDNSLTHLTGASDSVTNEKTQLASAQTDLKQADLPQIATQLSLSKTQPDRSPIYTQSERTRIVRPFALYLECHARSPLGAVA